MHLSAKYILTPKQSVENTACYGFFGMGTTTFTTTTTG